MGFSIFFLPKLISKEDTSLRVETKPERGGIVKKVLWDWDSLYQREDNVERRRGERKALTGESGVWKHEYHISW